MILTAYCQQASGVDWLDTDEIIGSSGNGSILPGSWSNGRLYLWDFDGVAEALRNPKTIVTKIALTLSVQCSAVGDSTSLLKAALTYNGSDLVTVEKYVPAGYQEVTPVTIEFIGEDTGRLLQRYDLRNESFGVVITPHTGLDQDILLTSVQMEITYNQSGYLLGESSVFPIAIDTISSVTNSTNPFVEDDSFVIKSELVNQVGDAIIKVQKLAAFDPDTLNLLGPGVLEIGVIQESDSSARKGSYVLTAIVTGVGVPSYFHLGNINSQTVFSNLPEGWFEHEETPVEYKETGKFATGHYSTILAPSSLSAGDSTSFQSLIADFVSCTGWVVSSGVYYPLQVTAGGVFYIDWDNNSSAFTPSLESYWMGFNCISLLPQYGTLSITSSTANTHMPTLRKTGWQTGPYATGANFEIRITAILSERTPGNSI